MCSCRLERNFIINRLSQLVDTIPFVGGASYQEDDEDEHCFKDRLGLTGVALQTFKKWRTFLPSGFSAVAASTVG